MNRDPRIEVLAVVLSRAFGEGAPYRLYADKTPRWHQWRDLALKQVKALDKAAGK